MRERLLYVDDLTREVALLSYKLPAPTQWDLPIIYREGRFTKEAVTYLDVEIARQKIEKSASDYMSGETTGNIIENALRREILSPTTCYDKDKYNSLIRLLAMGTSSDLAYAFSIRAMADVVNKNKLPIHREIQTSVIPAMTEYLIQFAGMEYSPLFPSSRVVLFIPVISMENCQVSKRVFETYKDVFVYFVVPKGLSIKVECLKQRLSWVINKNNEFASGILEV